MSEVNDLVCAIESLHEHDKKAMLKDLANRLEPIKADFEDSIDCEMTIILGEVYRQKIIDIFSILEKHGV